MLEAGGGGGGGVEPIRVCLGGPAEAPGRYEQADGSGHYKISPDDAPQTIADLRALSDDLNDMVRDARRLANIQPPGADEVSVEAARQASRQAGDPEIGAVQALQRGKQQIDDAVANLEADLKTYLGVEELNLPKAAEART